MATIIVCDMCGSKDNVKRRSYYYDRKMDAAGSMENVCETYDLCEHCELLVYKETYNKFDGKCLMEANKDLISTIKIFLMKYMKSRRK
jgi:hypothetical protein